MSAVIAYVDCRREPDPFRGLKILLDQWAAWARRDDETRGYPRVNAIWRLEHLGLFGAAIPQGYRAVQIFAIPDHVAAIDEAINRLARVDLEASHVVRASHIRRIPDRKLARMLRISQSTLWRRRKRAYTALARFLQC